MATGPLQSGLADKIGNVVKTSFDVVQNMAGLFNSKCDSPLIKDVVKSFTDVVEIIKTQIVIFNEKLTNIERQLKEFLDTDLMKVVKQKIHDLKMKIKDALDADNRKPSKEKPFGPAAIRNLESELQQTINDAKVTLQEENAVKNFPDFDEKMQKLRYAQEILVIDDGIAANDFQSDPVNVRKFAELSRKQTIESIGII